MYVIILQNNGKHCNLSNYIFHTSSLKNVSAILFISLFQPVMNTLPDCRIDRIKSEYIFITRNDIYFPQSSVEFEKQMKCNHLFSGAFCRQNKNSVHIPTYGFPTNGDWKDLHVSKNRSSWTGTSIIGNPVVSLQAAEAVFSTNSNIPYFFPDYRFHLNDFNCI